MGSDEGYEEIRKLWRYMSESKLSLMRALSFGAAGVLVANTLLLAQIGAKDVPLDVSLFASIVALPLWVAQAAIWEAYIFHGQRAHPHLRGNFTINTLMVLFAVAGLGVWLALAALVWHLSPAAAVLFAVMCLVAFTMIVVHDSSLKKYMRKVDS
jgi:hypothetical protein